MSVPKILTLKFDDIGSSFMYSLGKKIGDHVELKPERFPDGEFFVRIPESVRNENVYLITTMTPSNIFDVIITIDTLKRACAAKVTLVVPYLPYSRQDRRADTRTPISARVLADALQEAGADHVITMDVHALQIEGFYKIQFDNLQGSKVLIDQILQENPGLNPQNTIFVAPDAGAAKRTRFLAEIYGCEVAVLDKKRISSTEVKSYLIGDVTHKHCIMLDDMISSGGTMKTGAAVLKEAGSQSVLAGCIHMLGNPLSLNGHVYKTYFLNTIGPDYNQHYTSFKCFDVVDMFLSTIQADSEGKSISSMFNQ